MRDKQETLKSPENKILNRIVGKENESDIIIEGVRTKGLIDTGSMVSTVAIDFLETLNPKPTIHTVEELGLHVNTAGGQSLPYSGYVEVEVTVPFLETEHMLVPMLVVPMTDYNVEVPVIVGTNVIRQFENPSEETDAIPDEWKAAFNSIISDRVGVVKTTRKVTLQPNESRTVTGLLRKNKNSDAALTEPVEAGIPNVTVCPRIVRADKPGNIARVPVRLYNISARVVTIQPKSEICKLEGVTVLKADPIKEMTWLVGCFGFNGPLRQNFSLYRAVSQREGEREEKG